MDLLLRLLEDFDFRRWLWPSGMNSTCQMQFCPTIQRCCMTLPQHWNYTQILCFITPNTSSKVAPIIRTLDKIQKKGISFRVNHKEGSTIIMTMFFQSKILLEDRMRELIAKLILLLGWSHLSNTPLLQRFLLLQGWKWRLEEAKSVIVVQMDSDWMPLLFQQLHSRQQPTKAYHGASHRSTCRIVRP